MVMRADLIIIVNKFYTSKVGLPMLLPCSGNYQVPPFWKSGLVEIRRALAAAAPVSTLNINNEFSA